MRLIFIYGENAYRCRRALKEVVSAAVQKGLQVEYFFCAEPSPEKSWQEALRQESLWGGKKKLFVFLSPFVNETFQKSALQESPIFSVSGDTFLFYEEGVPDARNRLFLFLKKQAKCYECADLRGRTLRSWIQKEASRSGSSISSAALDQLAWFYGGDLWRLENEIKKLAAFARGGLITPRAIEAVCKYNLQATVFQFIDAVAEKNARDAVDILHRKIAEGEESIRLLGALVAQFRKILLIQEALIQKNSPQEIQAEWKMHPYAFQKTLAQARRLSALEVKKIYRTLFAADVKMKTGSQPGQAVLENLLVEMRT